MFLDRYILISSITFFVSFVYSEKCQRVTISRPSLQAECCIIKHEPDIVRIPLGPPPPPSRDGLKNFYHTRPHMVFKRGAPDSPPNKDSIGYYNEPVSCKPTQVNIQRGRAYCCVVSTDIWINTLRELDHLLSSGRFELVPEGGMPDWYPFKPHFDNDNSRPVTNENHKLQGNSKEPLKAPIDSNVYSIPDRKKQHPESIGTSAKPVENVNLTKEHEEILPSKNTNQGNRTLTLTEMFSNQGVMTAIESTLKNSSSENRVIQNNTQSSDISKVIPLPLVPPLSVPSDDNSSIVFPTELPPIGEEHQNNITAANGNTTMEFPNRNAIDVPKVCPKGQGRDASGQCLEVFE